MSKLLTGLAIVIVAAGCHSTVNMVGPAAPQAGSVIEDKRIVTDKSLRKKAGVINLRTSTVDDDLMKAQVQVRNSTKKRQRVNYRFQWFDSEGMRVKSKLSSWNPKVIQGKETVWITAVAPTPEVEDFRFKLIESEK